MSIKLLSDVVSYEARAQIVKALREKTEALRAKVAEAQNELMDAEQTLAVFEGQPLVAAKLKGVRSKKSARKSAGTKKSADAQLTSQQLQGQYLGKLRRIRPNKRAHFQKIARTEGRAAAIKALDTALARFAAQR